MAYDRQMHDKNGGRTLQALLGHEYRGSRHARWAWSSGCDLMKPAAKRELMSLLPSPTLSSLVADAVKSMAGPTVGSGHGWRPPPTHLASIGYFGMPPFHVPEEAFRRALGRTLFVDAPLATYVVA